MFDVHFNALDAGVLGGTYSNTVDTRVTRTYAAMAATATSALDRIAVNNLTPLSSQGGLDFRAPGTDPTTKLLTATTAGSVLDNNNSYNNLYLNSNTAVNRALGIGFNQQDTLFTLLNGQPGFNFRTDADADITFSSTFGFDYDPTDGIGVGKYDFVGVATHEMGHALGFVSGTDDYDYYIGRNTAAEIDQTSVVTNMDLFRYGAANPRGDGRYLQLDPNREAFFSIDGSLPFNFLQDKVSDSFFSTGKTNGDKQQASHWKDTQVITLANGCQLSQRPAGIMDPTIASCSPVAVTSNDLAVMDAIGYNLADDIYRDRNYRVDTSAIYKLSGLASVLGVPEPATWSMMVLGFGLIGLGQRRQRATVRFA